jgi:predicted kinase
MAGEGLSRPLLVALAGLPGAGKSMLARRLAPALGAAIVDRDALRAASFAPGDSGAAVREAATALSQQEISIRLQRGESCIADGRTLARAADRAVLAQLACDVPADFALLWLDCPVELAIERVRRQAMHPAPDRDEALVRAVAARFEVPAAAATLLRLDARAAPGELAAAALAFLGKFPAAARVATDHEASTSP